MAGCGRFSRSSGNGGLAMVRSKAAQISFSAALPTYLIGSVNNGGRCELPPPIGPQPSDAEIAFAPRFSTLMNLTPDNIAAREPC
jgi:hypothetical protein